MTVNTLKDGTITISGFEKGIADSPHLGLGDMRNVNILSSLGEAQVNFKMAAMTLPPTVSALSAAGVDTTDVFTVSSTSGWYNGMAITFNSVGALVGTPAITAGVVYWVGNLTATTFKLYRNASLAAAHLVNITTSGTGTVSSYTLTTPLDRTIFYSGTGALIRSYEFILDDSGQAWWIQNNGGTITNNLVYLGNTTLTGTLGRGIQVFNNYLIVFRDSTVDALAIAAIEVNATTWTYGWESISSVMQARRPTLVGQDNILYYGNDERVGSISEAIGKTFDPTDGTSYVENVSALDLPEDDVVSLGEAGVNLLIGGLRNFVYPWDRVSPSFNLPIVLPESVTYRIVSGNQLAFLFVGNRGRIYVTNGSSVEEYKKIPDYVTGVYEPYFSWGDGMTWRNQLYFTFTASTNAGVASNTVVGVWAIDLKTGVLRFTNKLSYGTYAGSAPVLLPNVISNTPPGNALYVGWSHSGSFGVDRSSVDPYSSFEAYIDSEIIPVGDFINAYMPNHFEFKLAKPLVSGEQIRLSYRTNLTDSFTVIGTTTTAVLSAEYDTNFQDVEWVQLRVELSSTITNPSYVPLTEIRMGGSR